MMKYLRILLVIIIVVLLAFPAIPIHAAGSTYYVAKTGSDSNDGSSAHPWLTIQHAASTLSAGDTVYVKVGTYNEQVTPANSGSSGNYITYKNYSTDIVIIDGTGINLGSDLNSTWGQGLIKIWGKSFLKFDGFEIYNADTDGADGVTVYPNLGTCSYLEFNNLKIHKTGRSAIDCYGSFGTVNNIKVYNCEIYDTNWAADQEAISLSHTTTTEVSYCLVHDIKLVSGYRQQGIDAKDGSSSILIHHNEVYSGTSVGIYIDGASADVYNNYIHDNSVIVGIMLGNEIEPVKSMSCNIYNNIISGVATSFSIHAPNLHNDGTDTYTFRLINNTIYNDLFGDWAPIVLYGSSANYTNCAIRNNIISTLITEYQPILLYCQNTPSGITIDHNDFYNSGNAISASTYKGTSYITTNPLMVNPSGTNFSLQSSSPARDVGSATNAPATDFVGISRPQNYGYDMGAYEYATATPTPTPTPTPTITPTYTPEPIGTPVTPTPTGTTTPTATYATVTMNPDSGGWALAIIGIVVVVMASKLIGGRK